MYKAYFKVDISELGLEEAKIFAYGLENIRMSYKIEVQAIWEDEKNLNKRGKFNVGNTTVGDILSAAWHEKDFKVAITIGGSYETLFYMKVLEDLTGYWSLRRDGKEICLMKEISMLESILSKPEEYLRKICTRGRNAA